MSGFKNHPQRQIILAEKKIKGVKVKKVSNLSEPLLI